ncbi:LysR substrate-binding domain-containing protein [Agrobacterium vitis]|uniref:LysR substrate-binding domain-containing protein n=1 Tax=Agrobacterium vitis TaxID=373 RepID=UPI0012E8BEE3|nr:LysR substrate-binding domain-containing protein [Agrobacterium vitis]MUZ64356.1 hypothetical protein [Agrobacterium vitis]
MVGRQSYHTTGDRFVDLSREGVDVAISYGDGRWKGAVSELLFEDKIIAVCSPKLLNGGAEPFKPELHTLIHDDAKPGWTEWFQSQGQADFISSAGSIYFNHTYLALQAAISGEGVALASEVLVSDSIVQGHLVNPTMSFLKGAGAYYFVTSSEGDDENQTRLFRDWLMTERLIMLASCNLRPE